jgi:hypothetical protein
MQRIIPEIIKEFIAHHAENGPDPLATHFKEIFIGLV